MPLINCSNGNTFSANPRTLDSNKIRFNISTNLEILIDHEPQLMTTVYSFSGGNFRRDKGKKYWQIRLWESDLTWLQYSPDLSPMKHLWGLDRILHKHPTNLE